MQVWCWDGLVTLPAPHIQPHLESVPKELKNCALIGGKYIVVNLKGIMRLILTHHHDQIVPKGPNSASEVMAAW